MYLLGYIGTSPKVDQKKLTPCTLAPAVRRLIESKKGMSLGLRPPTQDSSPRQPGDGMDFGGSNDPNVHNDPVYRDPSGVPTSGSGRAPRTNHPYRKPEVQMPADDVHAPGLIDHMPTPPGVETHTPIHHWGYPYPGMNGVGPHGRERPGQLLDCAINPNLPWCKRVTPIRPGRSGRNVMDFISQSIFNGKS